MTTRTRNAIALLACAALLCAAVAAAIRSAPPPADVRSPLQVVPAQAAFVLTLELDNLRASPFSKLIDNPAVGPVELSGDCSRRALQSVRRIALWVPDDATTDFGVIAVGSVEASRWIACTHETIASRGGVVTTSQADGFTLVSDASQGREGPMVAVREGGPVLIGRAVLVHRMIAVVGGRMPSAATEGDHPRMREALGAPRDATATLLVRPGVRERMRTIAGGDVPITRVTAVGAGLSAAPEAGLRAVVWCDGAEVCSALAAVVAERRDELRGSMALRVARLGTMLDGARVGTQGNTMLVETAASSTQIVEVLQRLSGWGETPSGADEPLPRQVPRLVLPRPDEVLRASGADGGKR